MFKKNEILSFVHLSDLSPIWNNKFQIRSTFLKKKHTLSSSSSSTISSPVMPMPRQISTDVYERKKKKNIHKVNNWIENQESNEFKRIRIRNRISRRRKLRQRAFEHLILKWFINSIRGCRKHKCTFASCRPHFGHNVLWKLFKSWKSTILIPHTDDRWCLVATNACITSHQSCTPIVDTFLVFERSDCKIEAKQIDF